MTTEDAPLIFWGRCRSGQRWFWTAKDMGGPDTHGWADTPDDASAQAHAAAVKLADGRYANIHVLHGTASRKLKALNTAIRQAKGPKRAHHPSDESTETVGYLYAITHVTYDADGRYVGPQIIRFHITRKTPRRVYYLRRPEPFTYLYGDGRVGYVDREELETVGSVRARFPGAYLSLFSELPEIPQGPLLRRNLNLRRPAVVEPDLKQLKAAMAAAHPDRGGTSEAFIAARETYTAARRKATR